MNAFEKRRGESETDGFTIEELKPGGKDDGGTMYAAIPTLVRTKAVHVHGADSIGIVSLLAGRWLVEGTEALLTLDALQQLLDVFFAASRQDDKEAFARSVAELAQAHAFITKQLLGSMQRIHEDAERTKAFVAETRAKLQNPPDEEPVH